MNERTFPTEFASETFKGAPAVAMAALTMNDVLIYLSIFYVLVQTSYLLWKWRREAAKVADDG